MEEYLITARSVTQAQRMAQLLERRGVRAVVGRVPMGLTGKGCGYVLRLRGQTRTAAALRLLREVKPTVIRGNISEMRTLAVGSGTTKGCLLYTSPSPRDCS